MLILFIEDRCNFTALNVLTVEKLFIYWLLVDLTWLRQLWFCFKVIMFFLIKFSEKPLVFTRIYYFTSLSLEQQCWQTICRIWCVKNLTQIILLWFSPYWIVSSSNFSFAKVTLFWAQHWLSIWSRLNTRCKCLKWFL